MLLVEKLWRAVRRISRVATGEQGQRVFNSDAYQIRDLAANIGILFKTPEEFFLGEAPQPFVREFDPVAYLAQQVISSKSFPNRYHLRAKIP